jgi:hypothetical protein
MATWVHKDGVSILVHALEVEPHLISGWSIDKNPKPAPKPKAKAAPKAAAKIPTLSNEA